MKQTTYITCFLFVLIGFVNKKELTKRNAVAGKMYFSAKPFTSDNSGSKTSFSSKEFIYCRFELSDKSIKDAFKIGEPKPGKPHLFLICEMEVLKNGEPVGYHKYKDNYILLQKENLDKTWLNLDILPKPEQATTLYSMLDDFSAGYGFVPLYTMMNPSYFPSGGDYRINVKIFSRTQDAWGRDEDEDKWPFIMDGFDFTLNDADIANLLKNKKEVVEVMQNNAFRHEKLPDVFSKPAKITDPKATPAKIAAILKRDLSQRTILKWVVEQYNGPLWSVAKDEFNLPKYRYFNPHIHVAYKLEGKCYVGMVTLRENYEGGGNYGPLEVAYTSASEKQDRGIDCEKIK